MKNISAQADLMSCSLQKIISYCKLLVAVNGIAQLQQAVQKFFLRIVISLTFRDGIGIVALQYSLRCSRSCSRSHCKIAVNWKESSSLLFARERSMWRAGDRHYWMESVIILVLLGLGIAVGQDVPVVCGGFIQAKFGQVDFTKIKVKEPADSDVANRSTLVK